jgi:Zn-dependent protease with chaperone function
MLTIPVPTALRIAQRLCDEAGVALILPDDLRRKAVIELVILARRTTGTVDGDAVRAGTTVTLPGVPGPALALLSLVPVVGHALAAISTQAGRTAIYLSPAAMADGAELLAVIWHELGHVGSIAVGGLGWCLAYLIAAEVRAGGEAPCYGAGMAVAVALGRDVDQVADEAKRSLAHYGLDAPALALAHGIVDSAAATIRNTHDFGGIVDELRAALAVEGLVLA